VKHLKCDSEGAALLHLWAQKVSFLSVYTAVFCPSQMLQPAVRLLVCKNEFPRGKKLFARINEEVVNIIEKYCTNIITV
jgi:hypothetical protein